MKLTKIKIKNFIGEVTRPLRYGVVRVIAPGIYARNCRLNALVNQGTRVPRPAILFIKNFMKDKQLIGAEIGVAEGINAESILKILNIKKLFLIDPYEPYYQDGGNFLYSKEEAVKTIGKL